MFHWSSSAEYIKLLNVMLNTLAILHNIWIDTFPLPFSMSLIYLAYVEVDAYRRIDDNNQYVTSNAVPCFHRLLTILSPSRFLLTLLVTYKFY